MDNPKLNFNVKQEDGKTIPIVIRTGEAFSEKLPNVIKINGTLDAPAIWAETKEFKKEQSHLIVDLDGAKITLLIGDHEHYQDTISGIIEKDSHLEDFKINTSKRYGSKELMTLLKFNRIFFPDRERNMKIVAQLQSIKGTVTKSFENSNDLKGKKKYMFEQELKEKYDLNFTLSIPLFKGEKPSKFNVEVNYDVSDGDIMFWLESVELIELIEKLKAEKIHSIVKRIKDITIIYV